jgi:hypothetical protein
MKSSNVLLILADALSFGVAVFQAVISFVPEWSAAFDAADELVSNPPLLLIAGLLMALVFGVFGLYGLSGAGVIRSLPLLRLGLLGIGSIYTLRGIAFVPQLLVILGIFPPPQAVPLAYLLASFIALTVGMLYLAGLASGWKSMTAKTPGQQAKHQVYFSSSSTTCRTVS